VATSTSRAVNSSIIIRTRPPTRYTTQWGVVSWGGDGGAGGGSGGDGGAGDRDGDSGGGGEGGGGEGGGSVVKAPTALQSL